MNKLLATIAVAKQNTYNMHWNVRGMDFLEVHETTETVFENLTDLFDKVAEKIAMHGQIPLSSYSEYLKETKIKELPGKKFTTDEVLKEVVAEMTTIIDTADAVETSNVIQPLLDEIYTFADKTRWLFKSWMN